MFQKEWHTIGDQDREAPVETKAQTHALGANTHVEDLRWIHVSGDAPSQCIETSEEIDESNNSVGGIGVGNADITRNRIDLRINLKDGTHNKHADAHGTGTCDEEDTTAQRIHQPLKRDTS